MQRREASPSGSWWLAWVIVPGIVAGAATLPAVAADRIVLGEEFSATW
jgi:hypothetical protein